MLKNVNLGGNKMTREQAKQKLISFGVAEPTEEQVTNLLNTLGSETKKEREKAESYKADAEKAEDLQRQLDELNNKNLSEVEKATAERDKALKSVTDLEAKIKSMEIKTGLAEQGIVGENADKLIESLQNGNFDTETLGKIIAEKEKNAVADYEKRSLNGTPDPNGNGGEKKHDDDKVENFVKEFGKNKADTENSAKSIVDSYL